MRTRLVGVSCCALFVLALVCASWSPVQAQATQQTQPEAAQPAAKAKGKANPGEARKSWEDRTEERIADLQTRLLITAEQQKAFNDLAKVMRDNAKAMTERYEKWHKEAATLTAVDSMKLHAAMSQARAESMKALVPVFETLYAQLSEAQKKVADEVFAYQGRQGRHQGKGQHQGMRQGKTPAGQQ